MITLLDQLISSFTFEETAHVHDNGLFHGKSGLAMIHFLLHQYSGNVTYSEHALLLLNEVSENISAVKEAGFENGLAGIGWSIEWAAQNKMLDINTDEILEDVDAIIYKAIMYAPDKTFFLANGTLGKLFYFFKRFESRNQGQHMYKRLYLEECLVMLTDELWDKISEASQTPDIYNTANDIILLENFGHALVFLSTFLQRRINQVTVEKTLYILVDKVAGILMPILNNTKNSLAPEGPILVAYQYLATCYYLAGKYHQHNVWEKQGYELMQILSRKDMNDENQRMEQQLKAISTRALMHLYLESPIVGNDWSNYLQLTAFKNLPLKLSGGRGALLLTVLSLNYKEFIGSWQELLAI
ncbi:lanthionine synthetase-like protein [Chitinophaga niastensis]|uniref:Lanthionine synthetase-like protein n=1 Tax=Chitinophaga niastensis TaxID=536980 RepID=A0A2P8HEQ4_CHINA|nr:lanthionine synthetase LanC family protein [Chitinophaga niastensis]PSL44700.1 lanthionine synthetase-like protein [Chitinophaga niastensis]